MSLEDSKARLRARISPNQPQLALADNTVLMAIAQALLAEAEDVRAAVALVQPQLFISQASGAALAARASDFGVSVSQGTPATGYVTFIAPAPASALMTIPVGTIVTTAGDGITTLAQAFATSVLDTVPAGYTTSASNQQETVTFTGGPTGGTFTLTHSGQTTAPITYSAGLTAATVQAALVLLSNVGTSAITGQPNVVVTGPNGGPFVVTWQYALGGLIWPVMTTVGSLTGGTTPAVTSVITALVLGTPVTATPDANNQYHAAANVSAGAITVISTPISSLSVTNATASGGTATTGGTDPDSDAQIRANTYKVLQPKYGAAAIEGAALAVSGVYDAYCSDPANGSGTIKLYWSDGNGNTPGLSGDTSSGGTITAATLAASVQTAVANVLPPDTVCNFAPFTIVNLTAVAVTVSAPAAVQTATLTPQVQAAVAAYVQGNGTARSGLIHLQVPNQSAMYMTAATGVNPQSGAQTGLAPIVSLTNFTLTSSTPAIGAASNVVLYRLSGTPSTVVSVTRV